MPTGYTAKLYEGESQTFGEFVLSCAHAFGALVTLREEPSDSPIPEFEPRTTYFDNLIDKGRARLAEVEAWTDDEANAAAQAAFDEAIASWRTAEDEKAACRARYKAMLAEVEAWTPPTDDHAPLKKFMREQLGRSIDFDCKPWGAPERSTGSEYRASALERARHDIDYGTTERAKEIERATSRNEWVKALRDSLPQSAEATA